MAVALDDAKLYLRIDSGIDDGFLEKCIENAHSYLVAAVDDFDSLYSSSAVFAVKADALTLTLIAEMYVNRDARNDTRDDYSYFVRSQITQLQYWTEENDA